MRPSNPVEKQEVEQAKRWRVGRSVPLNVYEGDRSVCQCHNAEDAARIVASFEAQPRERQMWINAISVVLAKPSDIELIGAENNDVRRALRPVADLQRQSAILRVAGDQYAYEQRRADQAEAARDTLARTEAKA